MARQDEVETTHVTKCHVCCIVYLTHDLLAFSRLLWLKLYLVCYQRLSARLHLNAASVRRYMRLQWGSMKLPGATQTLRTGFSPSWSSGVRWVPVSYSDLPLNVTTWRYDMAAAPSWPVRWIYEWYERLIQSFPEHVSLLMGVITDEWKTYLWTI